MNVKGKKRFIGVWWKTRVYHFVFIFSLVALTMLVGWWAIFINRSVQQAYEMNYEKILMGLDLHAFTLGHGRDNPPEMGVFKDDPRFEILASAGLPNETCRIFQRCSLLGRFFHPSGFFISPGVGGRSVTGVF